MNAQIAFFSFLAGALCYRVFFYLEFRELKKTVREYEELIDKLRDQMKLSGNEIEDKHD